ncbi:hypothetical protein K435DRAFT_782596 [Dendrothele bispora CBS 962.96]|uniref:Uncharacterized protein n=1 Tax=Dendrothele bispora (strain CBS 962.96) TaxID=1314807 RepID=A0A4S8LE86_DENBC|nr:hypothetical protein K435DRAFT_782596 [Dendrothele bispora CBS 962.96]
MDSKERMFLKTPSPPPPIIHPPIPSRFIVPPEESVYRGRSSRLAGYAIYQDEVERKSFSERHLRRPKEKHNIEPESDDYSRFRIPLLHSYLTNNDRPFDFDETVLRKSLRQIQSEIARIKQRRKETPGSLPELQRLRREQQILEDIQDDYQIVLSPVRHLPPEVLTLIFHMGRELRPRLHWQQDKCSDDYMERNADSSPSPTGGGRRPDVFLEWRQVTGICAYTRVCTRWRAAAIHKPSLWTSFAIDFQRLSLEDVFLLDPVSILQTVLSRTRDYPLEFTFSCPSFYRYPGETELRILCAHIRRWRNVTLELRKQLLPVLEECSNSHLREELPRTPHSSSSSPSLLQSLAIPIETPTHISTLSTFISSAPNLNNLEFTYEHECRHFLSQIHLPWGRITRLKGVPMRSCDLAQLLYHAPNLQELEYRHVTDPKRSSASSNTITSSNQNTSSSSDWIVPHTNLHTLTICNPFGDILQNVQLSSLKKLVLSPIIWPAEKTLLSTSSFLETSHGHCPLEELWILDIDATSHPEFLCKLLRSASTTGTLQVRCLALSFRRITSSYASTLTETLTLYPPHIALPTLPSLRHLQLKFYNLTSTAFASNELFYRMVRSRCCGASNSSVSTGPRYSSSSSLNAMEPLKRLELLIVRDLYGDETEFRVEELENDGLEVVITQLSPM